MNSGIIKKIVVLLIAIALIIIITIIVLYSSFENNKENKIYKDKAQNGENIRETYGKNSSEGIEYRAYFDVKTCMQKYLDYINMKNLKYGYYDENQQYISKAKDNEIKQGIYNLLSNKYINEKNITIENLYDNIKLQQEATRFVLVEASMIQEGNIKSFLIYGLAESKEDCKVIDKIFAVLNIDIIESKFSIELLDGNYTSISEINIEEFENTIKTNADNKCDTPYFNAKNFPEEYIELYRGLALGAPQKLYDLLDEEYRNEKFKSLDEFIEYIERNRDKISRVKLDKYKGSIEDNKARYVCIDQFGNYYIIKQNKILQDYTIMLDDYTIDLPEFIEKYNTSANNIKVGLNIEKLIKATKNRDYKYVYSKLNESFKSSNFKTQEEFEKYINQKFDADFDNITYERYEELTGVHVYHIQVTNKNGKINANVVMKLKDDRDFEISFGAES